MQVRLLRDRGICSRVDRLVAHWALSGGGVGWSGPVPVLSGVPRGSVLGPVLFLIFINDLPGGIGSSVRLFADDCVLCGNIGSPIGCQILQDDLGGLSRWETDWRVGFSVAVCHSVGVARNPP